MLNERLDAARAAFHIGYRCRPNATSTGVPPGR